MVLARIFSSAASTSSFTSLVARVYFTRNPVSAAAVPNPVSRWDFAGTGVADQAQWLPGTDPAAAGQGVNDGRVNVRVGVEIEVGQQLVTGKPAALTRRTERRRDRSSHSARNNSARNPW